MKTKPLKGKIVEITEDICLDCEPEKILEIRDVKSAVEGCLEEVIQHTKHEIDSTEIKNIFKKWFEDVM